MVSGDWQVVFYPAVSLHVLGFPPIFLGNLHSDCKPPCRSVTPAVEIQSGPALIGNKQERAFDLRRIFWTRGWQRGSLIDVTGAA
jgi:hypothetical protein